MDKMHQPEVEKMRHEAAIENLVRSQGLEAESIRSLYESVLAEMKRDAVITDFLSVLAERQVKELLRRKKRASQP